MDVECVPCVLACEFTSGRCTVLFGLDVPVGVVFKSTFFRFYVLQLGYSLHRLMIV